VSRKRPSSAAAVRLLSNEEIAKLVRDVSSDVARDFVKAGDLARALRKAKSDHPWTEDECRLLAELCTTLGVSEDV
jgi:hypothetical protein